MLVSETEAIAASASPRKPMVPTSSSSCRSRTLLVAWRRRAMGSSARRNAAAVVFHADQAHPTRQQAYGDLAGTGIQGVVHQFAHHRGGALYHLASGNLADQFIGQVLDGAALRCREAEEVISAIVCTCAPCGRLAAASQKGNLASWR